MKKFIKHYFVNYYPIGGILAIIGIIVYLKGYPTLGEILIWMFPLHFLMAFACADEITFGGK